jgi:hypothetical protein
MSVSIPTRDYVSVMPEGMSKNLLSPYGFAFLCSVIANHGVSDRITKSFGGSVIINMAYMVDSGCAHSHQLLAAHREMQAVDGQSSEHKMVGAMVFNRDDEVPALQAADIIAWCARRRELGHPLDEEYSPLQRLLATEAEDGLNSVHAHTSITLENIRVLAMPIYNWLYRHGSLPGISDMLAGT